MTAKFRKTWLSRYCSKSHQSKQPISMESACLETRPVKQQHALYCLSQTTRTGQLQDLRADRRYLAYRPVAFADHFLCLELSEASWILLVKRPFERKTWQKVFHFWKKRDLKTVNRLFSWVMPAEVRQAHGVCFSGLLYGLGFLARWC